LVGKEKKEGEGQGYIKRRQRKGKGGPTLTVRKFRRFYTQKKKEKKKPPLQKKKGRKEGIIPCLQSSRRYAALELVGKKGEEREKSNLTIHPGKKLEENRSRNRKKEKGHTFPTKKSDWS